MKTRFWLYVVSLLFATMLVAVLGAEFAQEGAGHLVASTPVRLMTRTPTPTHTGGWWLDVATWTPTPTGEATFTGEATQTPVETATPILDIPPVSTLPRPTPGGAP